MNSNADSEVNLRVGILLQFQIVYQEAVLATPETLSVLTLTYMIIMYSLEKVIDLMFS